MSGYDPRAQLAVLAAAVLGTLFGGITGLVMGAAIAVGSTVATPARRRSLGPMVAVLPVALFVALLDALAGRAAEGITAAIRLEETTAIAIAFARLTNARALEAGLEALRVPYAFVFVLVAGARFVPVTAADLGELVDAARLRGLGVDGGAVARIRAWRVLVVPLLVLTIRRGLQLGEAMEARGFSSARRHRTRMRLAWRARDTFVALLALAYVVAVALIGSRLG